MRVVLATVVASVSFCLTMPVVALLAYGGFCLTIE